MRKDFNPQKKQFISPILGNNAIYKKIPPHITNYPTSVCSPGNPIQKRRLKILMVNGNWIFLPRMSVLWN